MSIKKQILSRRYELIERIGIGGMSYVYKAKDLKTKEIVAIKELRDEFVDDEEFVKKFEAEAIASKSIKHNNVVCAYDVVHEGRLYYIVLEYVAGITLNKYIRKKGHLTNEETIDFSIQIAEGLLSAHKNGIIHRDVKPQNIIIDNEHIAKITDFGIARAISSNTKNISVVGTVHYISPEQAKNDNVDFRSDIYSLGCTMYEMITGKVPFAYDSPVSIIVSHIKENIKKPSLDNSDIYLSLEKIILKATRMLKEDRYQTMEELIDDLHKALKDKKGTFIDDDIYDEDDTGKTLVISDEQMQILKDISSKYSDSDLLSKNKLTAKEKMILNKYIAVNHNSKSKTFWIIVVSIVILIAVILFLIFFNVVFRALVEKNNNNLSTNSIVLNDDKNIILRNLNKQLIGMDVDEARQLVKDYGIMIVSSVKQFNDKYENNQIIKILDDSVPDSSVIDVAISLGSEVLDFSDVDKLHNTNINDLVASLELRNLEYSIVENDSRYIERGNIIGVNKKKSNQEGKLVITISTGSSKDIVTMPNVINLTLDEAREVLQSKNLSIGEVYYSRDLLIKEGLVIYQSVEKFHDVQVGSHIDLILSSGPNGEITEYVFKERWLANLNTSYIVSKNNAPGGNINDTIIISIRLMQINNDRIKYYELLQPTEYQIGTTIPLIFLDIEGEEGIYTGEVQVVDVEHDMILTSFPVRFKPTIK